MNGILEAFQRLILHGTHSVTRGRRQAVGRYGIYNMYTTSAVETNTTKPGSSLWPLGKKTSEAFFFHLLLLRGRLSSRFLNPWMTSIKAPFMIYTKLGFFAIWPS